MRYGIISDIHSNLEALSTVVEKLKGENIDKYLCLGDIVGYGSDPEPCCQIVRELEAETVLGNHDAAVSGRMDYSFYYEAAKEVLAWQAEILDPKHRAWLKSLPYMIKKDGMTLVHGSPRMPEDFSYVFTREHVSELWYIREKLAPVTFLGHSHLVRIFAMAEAQGAIEEIEETRIELQPDRKYIIAVGSVGQPRDYDFRASCVVYDDQTRIVEFHRLEYDVEQTALKIFDANLALNFGRRLLLGA